MILSIPIYKINSKIIYFNYLNLLLKFTLTWLDNSEFSLDFISLVDGGNTLQKRFTSLKINLMFSVSELFIY